MELFVFILELGGEGSDGGLYRCDGIAVVDACLCKVGEGFHGTVGRWFHCIFLDIVGSVEPGLLCGLSAEIYLLGGRKKMGLENGPYFVLARFFIPRFIVLKEHACAVHQSVGFVDNLLQGDVFFAVFRILNGIGNLGNDVLKRSAGTPWSFHGVVILPEIDCRGGATIGRHDVVKKLPEQ